MVCRARRSSLPPLTGSHRHRPLAILRNKNHYFLPRFISNNFFTKDKQHPSPTSDIIATIRDRITAQHLASRPPTVCPSQFTAYFIPAYHTRAMYRSMLRRQTVSTVFASYHWVSYWIYYIRLHLARGRANTVKAEGDGNPHGANEDSIYGKRHQCLREHLFRAAQPSVACEGMSISTREF